MFSGCRKSDHRNQCLEWRQSREGKSFSEGCASIGNQILWGLQSFIETFNSSFRSYNNTWSLHRINYFSLAWSFWVSHFPSRIITWFSFLWHCRVLLELGCWSRFALVATTQHISHVPWNTLQLEDTSASKRKRSRLDFHALVEDWVFSHLGASLFPLCTY